MGCGEIHLGFDFSLFRSRTNVSKIETFFLAFLNFSISFSPAPHLAVAVFPLSIIDRRLFSLSPQDVVVVAAEFPAAEGAASIPVVAAIFRPSWTSGDVLFLRRLVP